MAIRAAELEVWVGADTRQAEQGLARVENRLESTRLAAQQAGTTITASITAPFALLAKKALSVGMDYQSAMNLMQASSSATADQMAAVARKAKILGADMELPATSAADAALAMRELSRAGLNVEQSINAARGSLQLAASDQLGNAYAARVVANSLNAFSLEGEQAEYVANLLAGAANSSSAGVKEMADSLQMASAVGNLAGQSIGDVVAMLGLMAKRGIMGSDAGTSLKQMFLSLMAPTDKAADLMNALGISVYDSAGKMLDARSIISQFQESLATLTDQQRDKALKTLFGSDAIRAGAIIFGAGVEGFDEMLAAVSKPGAAAELAAAQMKGLRGAIEGLSSTLETFVLDLVEPMLPVLEGWVRNLANLVDWFGTLDRSVINAGLAFAGVVAAAGPLLLIFSGLTAAIGFLASPIGLVIGLSAGLAAAWAADWGGIRELVTGVISVVSSALSALYERAQSGIEVFQNLRASGFSPLEAAVYGLGVAFGASVSQVYPFVAAIKNALTALQSRLYSLYEQARSGIEVFQNLRASALMSWFADQGLDITELLSFLSNIQAALQPLITTATYVGTALAAAFATPWLAGAIGSFISFGQAVLLAIGSVEGLFYSIIGLANGASFVTGSIGTLWAGFVALVPGIGVAIAAFALITGTILGLVSRFQEIESGTISLSARFQEFASNIIAAFQSGGLQGVFELLYASISNFITNVIAMVPGLQGTIDSLVSGFQKALPTIVSTLDVLYQAFGRIIESLSAASPYFLQIAELIGGVLLAAFNGLATAIGNMIYPLSGVLQGLVMIVSGVVGGIIDLISLLVTVVVGLVTLDWANAWNAAGEILANLATNIANILGGLALVIGSIISGLITGIIGFFEGLYNTLVGNSIIPDMVTEIIDWFYTLDNDLLQIVEDLLNSLVTFISNTIPSVVNKAKEIGKGIVSGIKQGIKDNWKQFKNWVKAQIQGVIDGVLSQLGINSPSRVFIDIAMQIPRGLAVGIQRGMSHALRSATQMSQAVIDISRQKMQPQSLTLAPIPATASPLAYEGRGNTLTGNQTTIQVSINIERIDNEIDIHQLAYTVAKEIARRI